MNKRILQLGKNQRQLQQEEMEDYKLQNSKRKLKVFFFSFLSSFLILAPATK
jgi:hypothetical protein